MTDQAEGAVTIFRPPAWLRRIAGPFATRPRLLGGVLIGVLVGIVLSLVPNALRPSTRALMAWDLGVLSFCTAMMASMADSDVREIRARSKAQDEGRHFILVLVLTAAAISIVAIVGELSLAKADHGLIKVGRVSLAFATIALSWLLVQLIFALHYAHEYYVEGDDGGSGGGLAFPGKGAPDYWDFLHFSLVIGVASQTADIAFTSKALRRIGSAHSLIAFAFNTVLLALTINLVASLF